MGSVASLLPTTRYVDLLSSLYRLNQELQTVKGKSYTDTNRKDFECGKYREIKAGKMKSSRENIFCGASIISDRYGVEYFKWKSIGLI